jgi:hypothetical protein
MSVSGLSANEQYLLCLLYIKKSKVLEQYKMCLSPRAAALSPPIIIHGAYIYLCFILKHGESKSYLRTWNDLF